MWRAASRSRPGRRRPPDEGATRCREAPQPPDEVGGEPRDPRAAPPRRPAGSGDRPNQPAGGRLLGRGQPATRQRAPEEQLDLRPGEAQIRRHRRRRPLGRGPASTGRTARRMPRRSPPVGPACEWCRPPSRTGRQSRMAPRRSRHRPREGKETGRRRGRWPGADRGGRRRGPRAPGGLTTADRIGSPKLKERRQAYPDTTKLDHYRRRVRGTIVRTDACRLSGPGVGDQFPARQPNAASGGSPPPNVVLDRGAPLTSTI